MIAIEIFAVFLSIIILLILIYLIGRPIVQGALYFPTSPRGVREIMHLADVHGGQKIVDVGSGDGRVLIAAAKLGAMAVGYEINPWLVWQSRRAITRAGVADRITVHWESFWRADLSQFDTVIVYGIPYIMQRLKKKLERELRLGTKVISNAFEIPGWVPLARERKIIQYIFQKKE
jgi:protein-L-isoaspartate O-methyltransferase